MEGIGHCCIGHNIVDVNGSDSIETVERLGETLAGSTVVHLCLKAGDGFFGFGRIYHGVNQSRPTVPCIAGTFQHTTVIGTLRGNAQAVACLQWFGSRSKRWVARAAVVGAVVNVRRGGTAISIAGVDLHGCDVPRLRRLQQLGVAIWVPVERFSGLAAVALGEKVGGRDGGMRRVFWVGGGDVDPGVVGSVGSFLFGCHSYFFEGTVFSRHPRHVVVVVGPVDLPQEKRETRNEKQERSGIFELRTKTRTVP